jgi:hypothetical protein
MRQIELHRHLTQAVNEGEQETSSELEGGRESFTTNCSITGILGREDFRTHPMQAFNRCFPKKSDAKNQSHLTMRFAECAEAWSRPGGTSYMNVRTVGKDIAPYKTVVSR